MGLSVGTGSLLGGAHLLCLLHLSISFLKCREPFGTAAQGHLFTVASGPGVAHQQEHNQHTQGRNGNGRIYPELRRVQADQCVVQMELPVTLREERGVEGCKQPILAENTNGSKYAQNPHRQPRTGEKAATDNTGGALPQGCA